tara:strand:+ start:695 stop:1060 length:366 start_codon:yes stop_codon:yes gene_type:complete
MVGMVDDNSYKDFDAALSEAELEPIKFKMAGNEYELASQLPAKVVLTQMRFMNDDGGMSANSLPEWLESLVGKENLDEMLDNGSTWNQLDELLQWLLNQYGIGADDEFEVEAEGDEGDPKE